jgi:uncharacterized protein DUF5666
LASKRVPSLIVAGLAAVAMLSAVLAAPASAAIRHIDGTVVSKSSKSHSFGLSTRSGTIRIRVDAATVFERIAGFGALHRGLEVEVDAKQTANGLLAKQVETRGGGGDDHGGGGSDDGPNHT